MDKKFFVSLGLFLAGGAASIGVVYAQGATIDFKDVDYKAYYGDAVRDMSNRGVMTGYQGAEKFGPNDAVTRAQLATILKRYDDQLVNMYHTGGLMSVQNVLCAGVSKDNIPKDLQTDYDAVCAQP